MSVWSRKMSPKARGCRVHGTPRIREQNTLAEPRVAGRPQPRCVCWTFDELGGHRQGGQRPRGGRRRREPARVRSGAGRGLSDEAGRSPHRVGSVCPPLALPGGRQELRRAQAARADVAPQRTPHAGGTSVRPAGAGPCFTETTGTAPASHRGPNRTEPHPGTRRGTRRPGSHRVRENDGGQTRETRRLLAEALQVATGPASRRRSLTVTPCCPR